MDYDGAKVKSPIQVPKHVIWPSSLLVETLDTIVDYADVPV